MKNRASLVRVCQWHATDFKEIRLWMGQNWVQNQAPELILEENPNCKSKKHPTGWVQVPTVLIYCSCVWLMQAVVGFWHKCWEFRSFIDWLGFCAQNTPQISAGWWKTTTDQDYPKKKAWLAHLGSFMKNRASLVKVYQWNATDCLYHWCTLSIFMSESCLEG